MNKARNSLIGFLIAWAGFTSAGTGNDAGSTQKIIKSNQKLAGTSSSAHNSSAIDIFSKSLAKSALARTKHQVRYDPAYRSIAFPNGDVPADTGVCTDVVIRSYRTLGIDLQERVHRDMKTHFGHYPSKRIWGLTKPDTNIDHRRVPNLQVFFERHGKSLPTEKNPELYQPGDLVTWMLPGNLPHIGIVSDEVSSTSGLPLIVHNIGSGPKLEDMIFDYKITGHYRYSGSAL